jgi:hypothetical protein
MLAGYFRERSEPSGRETLTFRLGQCEICGNTPLYTLRSSFLWMERLLVQRANVSIHKRKHPRASSKGLRPASFKLSPIFLPTFDVTVDL